MDIKEEQEMKAVTPQVGGGKENKLDILVNAIKRALHKIGIEVARGNMEKRSEYYEELEEALQKVGSYDE